jgi:hypothetical protein
MDCHYYTDLQQTIDQSCCGLLVSSVDLGLPISMRIRTSSAINLVIPLIHAEMQCSSTIPRSTSDCSVASHLDFPHFLLSVTLFEISVSNLTNMFIMGKGGTRSKRRFLGSTDFVSRLIFFMISRSSTLVHQRLSPNSLRHHMATISFIINLS